MCPVRPSALISSNFPFEPTYGQQAVFKMLDDFLFSRQMKKPVFLLKGYAGTGKTTLVSALVKALESLEMPVVLMAPTGRAAKVMSNYSGRKAFTIHKQIYVREEDSASGNLQFRRKKNLFANTLFIVDEASMISDDGDFGERKLLTDLVEFVFERKSNRLMLIGDNAQLPPIKREISQALEGDYLQINFGVDLVEYELNEVVRQEQASGILFNATSLRTNLSKENFDIRFTTKGYKDFYKMTGEKLEEGLRYAYDKYGEENTVIICRSNKSATQYNNYVRRAIRFCESEIEAGDLLMVVRNNYTVLEEGTTPGFIANGDFAEIRKIRSITEAHGFRFAKVELQLIDYPDLPAFETFIFLDTLHSFTPSISQEENKKLYDSVLQDYLDIKTKKDRVDAIRKDPYLNALQVKFAYALTCHKSQGGQWKAVFVDQGYLTEEQVNKEFARWLYTAVTRASEELFLVNFNGKFF
ncbi:MAG: AAA family ATPase [Sporocytophaga sp.]|nr:AAA family ATPase [Sporocytophaga sp.]